MKKLFPNSRFFSFFGGEPENEEPFGYPRRHHILRKRRKLIKKHAFGGVFFAGYVSLVYTAVGMLVGPIPYDDAAPPDPAETMELRVSQKDALPPLALHVKTPDAVKAIYMSACVAATPSIRDRVINIANTTEVNSVVVDIKDFSGMISYEPSNLSLKQEPDSERSCRIRNIRDLIKMLHDHNIYVIGRIAVFQDPYYVKRHPELAVRCESDGGIWEDRKGITWLDAGSEEVWDYVIAIARDAYSEGFDEINFDYVRFPSDGNIEDMSLPISGTSSKPVIVKDFFAYLNNAMKTSGIITSADLFGMTTTANDDLNIGQVLENALPYFDYIAPMVYPSHYPDGFNGWANPNAHPYELLKFVMSAGAEKAIKASTTPLKLRPWLQDFSLGEPSYGKQEVEDQIQATYDSGLTSWMLWDPSNKYEGGALLRE